MSSEEPSGLLARPAVRRVQAALEKADSGARVIALERPHERRPMRLRR